MPRLNLDIFGSGTTDERKPVSVEPAVPVPHASVSTEKETNVDDGGSDGNPVVRFIPVGFHEKHLRLLDDAVHELRKKRHYKASKSGIIRALIERHAHELEAVWRSGARTMHGQ